jgi:osmoprotectant transport system permease protein
VTTKTGLGSTILFDALKVNQVDCYVDYSGTIWATIMHRRDVPSRAAMIDEMSRWLDAQYGIRLLGPLGFENTYTLAMRREDAERKKISSIEELSPYAPVLVIGSDYEFFARAEWAALKETYRLAFAREMTFDPSLMYGAVREGKVDVISAYSTDGRIIAFDLRTLSDPQRALPPYDAVLLLSPSAAKDRRIAKALMPLLHAIDDTAMREANKIVDVDRRSVEEAAGFLGERIDGGTP